MARRLVVADADLVIDYLRDHRPGADAVERLRRQRRLCLAAVTAFELRVGTGYEQQRSAIDTLLRRRTLRLDTLAALAAGAVFAELRARGRGIGVMDSLLAGTCLRYGLPLATRNVRHFERVPGLRLAALED